MAATELFRQASKVWVRSLEAQVEFTKPQSLFHMVVVCLNCTCSRPFSFVSSLILLLYTACRFSRLSPAQSAAVKKAPFDNVTQTRTSLLFLSEVAYSFSWKQERDLWGHLKCKESPTDQERNAYDKNPAPVSIPKTAHKAKNTNTPFTKEENHLLKRLKEEDQLTWAQRSHRFARDMAGLGLDSPSSKLSDFLSLSQQSAYITWILN